MSTESKEQRDNSNQEGGRRKGRRRPRGEARGQGDEAERRARSKGRRGRRNNSDSGPAVAVADTGRNPKRHRGRPRRARPAGGMARRRRLSRSEVDDLTSYFEGMPDALLSAFYRGLGGQPSRVSNRDRMIQLVVRAVAQGARLGILLKAMHEKDRQALAILIQCGGLAHATEFHRELFLSLGGHEHEWKRVMQRLGEKGLVFSSDVRDNEFFYLVPHPLVDHLVEHLATDMVLPQFKSDDVRVLDERPFCPPLGFSIATLATYMDQRPPRLTQRQEIYKVHKEEMDVFFSQVYEPDSELFGFHIDFLMMHGMVELRGDRISVNPEVVEEWLNLDPDDQRELIFQALEHRFPNAEWILWAVHSGGGEWMPDNPLQALYRRWHRGEDWRKRFRTGLYGATKSFERESFSFAPLVNTGMLEVGLWGQEKFYRLSARAQHLLSPPPDDGFSQFYLTPSFEIMAPAGLAPVLLMRIGELAELTGCDRANTYKITEATIERALARGWRRDDVIDFLRDYSQIGLPENVEQTIRGWMGHHGDAELHDLVLLTVHRAGIRKVETSKRLKPLLLHRFAPGMYAVDRTRLSEVREVLSEVGFHPAGDPRRYPAAEETAEARGRLREMVETARATSEDPLALAHAADTAPDELHPVPGSGIKDRRARKARAALPPRTNPEQADATIKEAIAQGRDLEMVYVARDEKRTLLRLSPERLAINREGIPVLVARDLEKDERLTYRLPQIERLRTIDGAT